MARTTVDSGQMRDDSIVNADVSATAAIAGTKISPNFGAQNLVVDTNVLFVDTSTDRVGIGLISPAAKMDIFSSTAALTTLQYWGNSGTGFAGYAAFDYTGSTTFEIGTIGGGSTFRLQPGTGGLIINESGADADVRIEGDTVDYLFHLDASQNTIGIGRASGANYRLDIKGATSDSSTWSLRCTDSSDVESFSVRNNGSVFASSFLSNSILLNHPTNGNNVFMNTVDAADNGLLQVGGGGAAGVTRGAYINFYGNENASTGKLQLLGGNVGGGHIEFYTGNTILRWYMLQADGSFQPGADATYDIGVAGGRVLNVFAVNFKAADGGVGAPTLTFINDTDTGFFRPGTDSISLATAGTLRLNVDSAGTLSVGATAQFRVGSDGDLDRIKDLAYSWPTSHGSSGDVLTNNGSGTLTWAAAGGSGGLAWTKYTVAETAFTAAATSESITLFSLAAGGVIHGVKIRHTASFTGGGLTAFTVEVGIAGATNKYASAFDVFQAASDTTFQTSHGFFSENHGSTTTVQITARSVGANVSAATAGSVEVWVLTSTAT